MSTVTTAVPQTPVTPAGSFARKFYWTVRRELWENRYLYIAPAVIGVVFLLGVAVSAIHLVPALFAQGSSKTTGGMAKYALSPYDFAAGLMMLTSILIGAFYSVEALYGERRDRSILFWKSMPVSDWTTVLSKAAIPILLVPLFGFFVAVVTHLGVLIIALVSGGAAAHIGVGPFFQMELLMLYHFITVHALWPAPVYAWFLLVSAWSRRVPFIWAVLPPLAVFAVEKIAFNTSYLAETLGGRILGAGAPSAMEMANAFPTNPATHVTPGMYLVSPGLWIGLAITGALLFAAARLRRQQGPAY